MIHVILGAPCSGKSTYVREHAADDDVIVDYDVIAQALGRKEAHSSRIRPTNQHLAAFVARRSVIEWATDHADEVDAWIIHTNPMKEDMDRYEACGAELTVMETDMETCLARAEADNRPPGTDEIIREYFEAAKAAFFMPGKEGKMHQRKACVKSELKEDGGTVKGYASTFDRDPDAYGDVVAPGAFAKSLERWKQLNGEGKYIPLLWGHDTFDPTSNIGRVVDAVEDERGLLVTAEFDAENEKAQYVRKLVQEGRVYQFSFAFEIRDQGLVELENGMKANELRDLELFEVSLVQIPANQHATVEEVKSADELMKEAAAEIKAGRRNSAKDADALREVMSAAKQIQEVVSGLLAEDEADAADGDDGGEAEKSAEGQKSQAEFVDAYKQAVLALIGD